MPLIPPLLMPLSRNKLLTATVTGATPIGGTALANLTDPEPRKVCTFGASSEVIASTSDQIPFNIGGSTFTAALTAAVYNAPAMCDHIAVKLNAADASVTDAACRYRMDGAARFRYEVFRTGGGTIELENATTSRNWCTVAGGWIEADTGLVVSATAEQPHTMHETDLIAWDFGEIRSVQAVVVLNHDASAGLRMRAYHGAAAATETAVGAFREADNRVEALFYSTPQTYRYGGLLPIDDGKQHRSTWSIGYVYAGDFLQPTGGMRWNTVIGTPRAYGLRGDVEGRPRLSEVSPGSTFTVDIGAGAMRAHDAHRVLDMLAELGREQLVIVAGDPVREPNLETRLCAVENNPVAGQRNLFDRQGLWSIPLTLRVVEVV